MVKSIRRGNNGSKTSKKTSIIGCLFVNKNNLKCSNKAHPDCGNKYCRLHISQWLEFQQTGGKPVRRCSSRTKCNPEEKGRSLKAILPDDYPHKRCAVCLEKERSRDKIRRNNIVSKNEKIVDSYFCKKCGNEYPISEVSITSLGQVSYYCEKCFNTRQQITKARNRVYDKEYGKEYESRPERKLMKKKWREDNQDKVKLYYTESRAKKLMENPDEYRKRNAENAKKWREKNPDKVAMFNENRKKSIDHIFYAYQDKAERRGLKFFIDRELFEHIIKTECYYCDYIDEDGINGMDRLNNNGDYSEDNTVACCKMCNFMKNTLNESTFILMCSHISYHNNYEISKLYPHVFNNYCGDNYEYYVISADKRGKTFELTKKQYYKLKNGKCYLCGRESNDKHNNGIDRYDNSQGYTIDNCRTCCGDCNYMKKNYDYDEFINQCALIAENHFDRFSDLEECWEPSKFNVTNTKKLSKDDMSVLSQKKKEIRHQKTMSTKTPKYLEQMRQDIRKRRSGKNIFDV